MGGTTSKTAKYHVVEPAEIDPYAINRAVTGQHANASGAHGAGTGPLNEPTGDIELSIECANLKSMDVLSQSDPMVVVYTKNDASTRRNPHRN